MYVSGMGILRESDVLGAVGYLCNAADNLRAIGLVSLAEEIDSFIVMLEAEILLRSAIDD